MSTYPVNGGNFPFEVTSDDDTIDGGLELTYTMNGDGTISNASVSYTPPGSTTAQTFDVTFTESAPPYTGTASNISPAWSIPNQGDFGFATLSFTPPSATDPNTGSLTGTASISGLPADDPIDWKADPSVPLPEGEQAAKSGGY